MNDNFVNDSLLGPAAQDLGWVPAPRYLLRRARILRQLSGLTASELVEIGPGAGMLMQELSAKGFSCYALETSPPARQLIQALSARYGHRIELRETPAADWQARFPLVMAFEVLEHIEDDHAAFRQWASWLKPGGTLLISVPAHPSQWNAADVWAGHFRRYRKHELKKLVEENGLQLEHIECMGFPLANVTERMQARGIARDLKVSSDHGDRQNNNDRSGIERGHVMRWYPLIKSLPGRIALRGALFAQQVTGALPFGNSYLVRARRPA